MRYGLIGEKLGHSFSEWIHQELGNSDYILKELKKNELDDFLKERKFEGLNVTIPYKQSVMEYCQVDPIAAEIGSVNTLVQKNGRLFGFNTDYLGFLYMAERKGIDFSHKKIAVLGSGGTSKTICYAVLQKGAAKVMVLSRNAKSGNTGEADIKYVEYGDVASYEDADILVNTTPVGMYPGNGETPIQLDCFIHLQAVIDVIFNPLMTRLLLDAEKKSIPYTNGLPMLVAQAWFANCLFFGKDATLTKEGKQEIERILLAVLHSQTNYTLIGMPGVGKTTIGEIIASEMNRPFYDVDVLFLEKYKISPAEYITRNGEEAFREEETKILKEITGKTGIVLATGGGSVQKECNRDYIKQNSTVIFLTRPLDMLATDLRPLSKSPEAIRKLYRVRLPLYRRLADYEVELKGSPKESALGIMKEIRAKDLIG